MLLIGSYLVGQSASDTALGRVLAILPLTSTMVMPSRIAIGEATGVEVVASLVLGLAAVAVALRVGGTIYRRAVVRTGRRLKVTDVLRSS
jgi:ABC-2 type transport system permease protein